MSCQLLLLLPRLKIWLILALLSSNAESATARMPSGNDGHPPSIEIKEAKSREDPITTHLREGDSLKNSRLRKRSIDTLSSYFSYNGYNPSRIWMDPYNEGNPRLTSRFGYDPFSLWRKKKHYPRYKLRPYLKSFVDDSMANWALNEPYVPVDAEAQPRDIHLPKRKYYYPIFQEPIVYAGQGEEPMKEESYFEDSSPFQFVRQDKRSVIPYDLLYSYEGKRSPSEMGARGFHEGIFTHGFGDFSTVKRSKRAVSKRRPEMDASGFHGDTFSNGFGNFYTMKRDENPFVYDDDIIPDRENLDVFQKRVPEWDSSGFHGDTFSGGFGDFYTMRKRRPEMDSFGFHGDTFNNGFGDFYTMKRRPEMSASGFHGDTFSGGFGDFYTMKREDDSSKLNSKAKRLKRETSLGNISKRKPEMTSIGFNGDTFSGGFGDFYTMKRDYQKRLPEMTSSGFHGDTFTSGFGDFYTMKRDQVKRRPEMTSNGFHGDAFSSGFGDFYTMKRGNQKRRPEMTSSGFYGDTFTNGFGDFYTMKRDINKRRPEMTSSGFYGDTFNNGFGDFYTMKRNYIDEDLQQRANDVKELDNFPDRELEKNLDNDEKSTDFERSQLQEDER